jgi:hypothetical protein
MVGRLADRLRVRCVVLLALDEWFDVDGRDQSNLVAQIGNRAPPVMRASAGFHGDNARRLFGKEGEDFLSRKLLAERHASVGVGAVRLKGPLCQIDPDDANLFHGCLFVRGMRKHRHFGTLRCRQEGASTPSLGLTQNPARQGLPPNQFQILNLICELVGIPNAK